MSRHPLRARLAGAALFAVALAALPRPAHAGGGPENVVLVVDPSNQDALQVANHYIAARGIPTSHIIYMAPGATDYPAFTRFQLPALLGTLAQRGLAGQIDTVIVPSGDVFYISAPGLVKGYLDPSGAPEQCPVSRLSLSGAYTLAYSADEILGAGLSFYEPNRYYAQTDTPTAFSSQTPWLNGEPGAGADARRYLLGFQLGYSGPRGNTADQTIAMIDRSVGADGTRPDGTFYFMRNADIRSTTRTPYFDVALQGLARLGFKGEVVDGQLPEGRHDALGIMAGSSDPAIGASDITLLPGSFADHLTSYAATFDSGSQVKMSEWIPKGASGSMGTVEEPCVFGSDSGQGYNEKFPHPRLFTWYVQGMSLGEALFRSVPFTPFQALFYGDPLTRAFAHVPTVSVPDAPNGPVMGVVTLHPETSLGRLGGKVNHYDLFVDGLRVMATSSGAPEDAVFAWDTTRQPDGPRVVRVVAYDDVPAAIQGWWSGTVEVRNQPARAVTLTADAQSAESPNTVFHVTLAASGGTVTELQLLQNGRVLAASNRSPVTIPVLARDLGVDHSELVAVARYDDAGRVSSAPLALVVQRPETYPAPDQQDRAPLTFSYNVDVDPAAATVLDLPATDEDVDPITRTVVTGPAQATLDASGGAYLLRPNPSATGDDSVTFQAADATHTSANATVTLHYCAAPTIVSQPVGGQLCPGADGALEVTAQGTDLAYQWYKNGELLPGATAARLDLHHVKPADTGGYSVTVASRCGARWLETPSQSVNVLVAYGPNCVRSVYLPWANPGR